MGYKVTNRNAIVNLQKNIAMDNVFFFQTKDQAEDYVRACEDFQNLSTSNKNHHTEMVIEECTTEENEKYVFNQYHSEFNPDDVKVPNIVIERPIEIVKGVPYWTTRRELTVLR